MPIFSFIRANAGFLLAGFLLAYLSSFGQTFFISTFAGEIRADFGLSHGQWGAIYGSATTVSAGFMLWSGGLTDKFRVRALGAWVMGGLVLACLFMAVASAVWALVIAIFVLRFMGQGMMSHMSGVAMARWFVASRGRALAIAALGFSAGEASLPVTFVAAKQVLDWRMLWVVAALVVTVAAPLLLILLRAERTPQSMAQESHSVGMKGRHWTRGQALRHPLFWLLFPALMGPGAFGTAFFFQQVHLAEVKGWSHVALVAIFPFYSGATVVAMLGSGWAVDRFGPARLMPLYQLPAAAFFLFMGGVQSLAVAAPLLILLGLTSGAGATVPTAFWAEFFGSRHLGSIRATAAAAMVLGSAIGPWLTGFLIDRGMPYPQQMIFMAAYFGLASVLVWVGVRRARRDLPPATQVDVERP
ncbi:MAG: MFS transporter [Paracoccaceae bacterium]|nr:MFS transporter [Paracoccaceae bacterium]